MSDVTIYPGETEVISVVVSISIVRTRGVSVRRSIQNIALDGYYFANDNITDQYFSNDSQTDAYRFSDS